jgi:hypothetical protein
MVSELAWLAVEDVLPKNTKDTYFLILMRVPPSYEPPRCTSGQDTVYLTKEPDGNGVEPVGGSPEQ